EDNWDRFGRLLGGQGVFRARGQDHVNLTRHQLGRESGEPLCLSLCISVLDHHVAALDVTEVMQSLTEGLWKLGTTGQVARQIAYPSDLGRLLRLDGERRGEDAPTHDADERSPVHQWMISSARTSSDCGIVTPSAFAVLRLTTNSSLVGCTIGRSAGLSPFRIRPV